LSKKDALANNLFYRNYSNERDLLAEKLLNNSKRRSTEITQKAFIRVIEMVFSRYASLIQNGIPNIQAIQSFEAALFKLFEPTVAELYFEAINLRKKSYLLSHISEAITLAILKKTKPKLRVSRQELDQLAQKNLGLYHKMLQRFNVLKRKIINELERSIFTDEDVNKAVGRVFLAFPRLEHMERVRKLKRLKPMREAKPKEGPDAFALLSSGEVFGYNIDQTTWSEVLRDIEKEFYGTDRSPENVFDIKNPWTDEPIRRIVPADEAFYGWEVEQETTHDFVTAVRQGEITAAKENGVDDFMWVAILDKKTCERCCEWRDGLTTKEIEEKLEADPELGDYCDSIVAPAHFNCRCRMAPVSSQLVAEVPETDAELEDWLKNL
jgi:hypothetical protein